MSLMNRFSYNQAVNPDGINLSMQVQPLNTKRPSFFKRSINHHESQRAESSSSENCTIEARVDEFDTGDHLEWLLPGEELKHKELSVAYEKPDRPDSLIPGLVFVTNYRVRFESIRSQVAGSMNENLCFDVTLGSISKVEKIGYRNIRRTGTGGEPMPYGIVLICKDLRNVRFIHRRESHSRRAMFNCLRKYAFPNTNRLPFFATLYREKFQNNGWNLFSVIKEFDRQRVPKDAWRLSRINEEYKFAGTYPALFYVPCGVFKFADPDEFINLVSEFRSKKRIPVLSWIDHRSCAALVRSSQPLVGALSRKSASDEDYLEMIIDANADSSTLVILDARPKINARVNRANGGGYEDYPRCTIQFMDIQNIHEVRKSLRNLKDACFPRIRQKYFQRTLEETKWLSHLQTILEAAALTAREISLNKNSVLVHCSDGWDRTAQITSLAMLQLDQYYRTIEGFAVLVEKEWCSFGHKFAQRVGHGQDKPDDQERSPIFVQFIDCVWQLYNQFTTAFEFNVRFLKTLLDELYSCRFGTFLYNSERERHDLEVKLNTVSLWSFILDNKVCFTNPNYDPRANLDDFVRQKSFVYPLFWTDYYCRYSQLVPPEIEDISSLSSKVTTPLSNFGTNSLATQISVGEDNTEDRTFCANSSMSAHSGEELELNSSSDQIRYPRWKLNGQKQVPQTLIEELKQRYQQNNNNNHISPPSRRRLSPSASSPDQITRV